jgi:hypothetical protein
MSLLPPEASAAKLPERTRQTRRARQFELLIALLAWSALAAQAGITINRLLLRGFTVLDGLERMASYLTNLTVLLTALCFSALAMDRQSPLAGRWPLAFLRKPPVVSAIVVYLAFVGVAYNVLLRHLWTPSGLRVLVNETLHSVLPLLAALYWLWWVPRFQPHLRQCLAWLVYPLGYLWLTLWRGRNSGFYPYPFIDVDHLGYTRALFNACMLLLGFVVLMCAFIAFNHKRKPRTDQDPSPQIS